MLSNKMRKGMYSGISMRHARSLASAQTPTQHIPCTRFVTHANASISLLAIDEIHRLYIQVINGLAVSFHFILNFLYMVKLKSDLQTALLRKYKLKTANFWLGLVTWVKLKDTIARDI